MLLSHDNLANFYRTNFTLMHVHKYSLTELEEMLPWERMLYIDFLRDHTKKENERRRDIEALQRREGKRVG